MTRDYWFVQFDPCDVWPRSDWGNIAMLQFGYLKLQPLDGYAIIGKTMALFPPVGAERGPLNQ